MVNTALDGSYRPLSAEPGYYGMAPCMRSCDWDIEFNGCDKAKCWCNKPNLDLRMSSITRCASSSCTFANMNTQTDLDALSVMQVEYCADKGYSPAGMTLPSTADATPTSVVSGVSTVRAGTTTSAGVRQTGPASTSDSAISTTLTIPLPSRTSAPSSSSSSGLSSTAAKAGISIGATACVLIFCLILILLCRRRRPKPVYVQPQPVTQGPAPPYQPPQAMQPQPMAPTPYQNGSPFSPPPRFAQPAPIHIPQNQAGVMSSGADVSPIDEKAGPLVSTTPVTRKELPRKVSAVSKDEISVADTPPAPSPTPAKTPVQRNTTSQTAQYGAGGQELHGDVPPPRHEVGNDGQITNTVSIRGMELDAQGQQQHQGSELDAGGRLQGQGHMYQQSVQGAWQQYPQHGAQGQELDGGAAQQRFEMHGGPGSPQQRHEMPGQVGAEQSGPYGQQGQQRYEMPGHYGYHGAPYEIGPSR